MRRFVFLKQEQGAEWGHHINNSSCLLIIWHVHLSTADKWEGFCHDVDHSRSQSQSAHFSLWDQICTWYIHVLRSHLGVLMEFMRSFSVCVSTSALSAAGDLQKFVAALKDGSSSNSQSSSWLPDVFLLYTMSYAYFRKYSHPCATLH